MLLAKADDLIECAERSAGVAWVARLVGIHPGGAIRREDRVAGLNAVDDDVNAELHRMRRVQGFVLLAQLLHLRDVVLERDRVRGRTVEVYAAHDAVGRDDAIVRQRRAGAGIERRRERDRRAMRDDRRAWSRGSSRRGGGVTAGGKDGGAKGHGPP